MIVEWLLEISAGFLEWLAGLFPPVELPEWVEEPFAGFDAISEFVAGANTWVDLIFLAGVVAVVLLVYGIGATIKLVRAVVAHVPFFGGNG